MRDSLARIRKVGTWLIFGMIGRLSQRSGGARGLRSIMMGFAIMVTILLALAWKWQTPTNTFLALDPASAAGPCRGADGSVLVFCDFAKHYYPQGRGILSITKPASGFFYPAPFALLMTLFAGIPYGAALSIWVVVGLGCAAVLYLMPQAELFSSSKTAALAHGALFASSLPVLHNFIWGQVSVLVSLLALGALTLYRQGRRNMAAMLLAAAVSIKFYPALFAIGFVLRRDIRTLAVFVGVALGFIFVLPIVLLGIDGTILYYKTLDVLLGQLSLFASSNPYPNYIVNAGSILVVGKVLPGSVLADGLQVAGLLLVGTNAVFLYLLLKARAEFEHYWEAALIFTMIPLAVGTSWVHYFVYLPFVQAFVLMLVLVGSSSLWLKVGVCVFALLPSVILSNVFFFLQFYEPDHFYRGGYLFWSSALLLPALYVLAGLRLQRQAMELAHMG